MKTTALIISVSLLYTFAFAQNTPTESSKDENSQFDSTRGNLLPEVLITENLQLKSLYNDDNLQRADEFQLLPFKIYAIKTEEQIAKNEKEISFIKSKLKKTRGKSVIKHWHQIASLEVENEELKVDFWNYLHYGIGNWNLFKSDFNEDLEPLAQDIARLQQEIK